MDILLSVLVGFAIGGALLVASNPLARGWLTFCEDEWALELTGRVERIVRLSIACAGCLFILLGLTNLLRGLL